MFEGHMEQFFAEPLRYWVTPASVRQIACSTSFPPRLVAAGDAACVRAWNPEGGPAAAEFAPVVALAEMDGSRKSCITMHADSLAVGDTSSGGLVSVWDTLSWERKQTLQAGAPVSALLLNGQFLAAGTSNGCVRVWKRGLGGEWQPALVQDLVVEPPGRPCMTLCFGQAPDGACLLVGHSAARCRLSVWRLTDGQLLQTLGCVVDAKNVATLAVQANVAFAFMDGWMLTMVSWMQGHDPVIQVMDVLARQSHDLTAPDRLAGRGRPLAADFRGGKLLAIGFEDGAIAAFGFHGWLRFHPGAVGAVRVLPERMQIASSSADGSVRLWSGQGALLASVDMGFQVTALSSGDIYLAAGGAQGEVQVLVLAAPQQTGKEAGDHQGGGEDAEAGPAPAPPLDDVTAAAAVKPEHVLQYTLYFDSRAVKEGAAAGSGAQGRVADHFQAYEAFAFPRRVPVSAEELLAVAGPASAAAAAAAAGEGHNGTATDAAAGASSSGGAGSEFSMKAALAGATRSKEDVERDAADAEQAAAELKKKQLAQMGEDKGVARNAGVVLESNTARVGRKCDSASCLVREGLGGVVFKRCGACKSVYYCSVHCQRTHYRDRHKQECAALAEAAKERQRQQLLEDREASEAQQAQQAQQGPPQQQEKQEGVAELLGEVAGPVLGGVGLKEGEHVNLHDLD